MTDAKAAIDSQLADKIAETPHESARRGRQLLRDRSREGHARVGFLELFYDLVFVFAITQLSHRLLKDVSIVNGLETLFLFVAVWWVWMYTTWAMNWLDPDNARVRLMVFALTFIGLVMSMAVPGAFAESGLAFALAYASMQVLRTAFIAWAAGPNRTMRLNFVRILIWFAVASLFWIAGAFVDGAARGALWLVALGVDLAGPIARFYTPVLGPSSTSDWDIEGEHMAERCALFIIIALGESRLVTGATFEKLAWTATNWLALVSVVAGTLAMWWAYFDTGLERGAHHIAHSADPGAVGRRVYTYFHAVIVFGIVVMAVGDELILAHPIGHLDASVIATVVGGPALYVFGNLLFKREIAGFPPLSHLVGLGLLGLGALVAPLAHREPLHLGLWATGALIVVAVWEWVSLSRGAPEAKHHARQKPAG
jgi:low temperature requirement protein LtrA